MLGIRDRDYTWAEYDIQHMISTIADAAHVSARLRRERDECRSAIESAEKGLLADPCSVMLREDAVSAALAMGDRQGAERLLRRLEASMADLDPELVS